MVATVRPDGPGAIRGFVVAGPLRWLCALGRGGVRRHKREGDGATPEGTWPIRKILYRRDKLQLPGLAWPAAAIGPDDGWCDDPTSPLYNTAVTHPHSASAERLWRDDDLYDIIAVLGYNDRPLVPGLGSAIFLHVAHPGYAATQGCIALKKQDLISLLVHVPAIGGVRVTEK